MAFGRHNNIKMVNLTAQNIYADDDAINEGESGPLITFIIKFRLVICLMTVLIVAALSLQLGKLSIDNDFRIWFPEDSKYLKNLKDIEEEFTRADDVMLVFGLKQNVEGSIFNDKLLNQIRIFTEESWQIPNVVRVDSISNFLYSSVDQDNLLINQLIEEDFIFSIDNIVKLVTYVKSEPAIMGRLVSEDLRTTAIRLSIAAPDAKRAQAELETVEQARLLAAQLASENSDIDVHLIGTVMRNNAVVEATNDSAAFLYPLLFVTLLILSGLLFRSISAVVIMLSVIVITLLATLSLVASFGWALSTVSLSAPIVIITVAIASVVHLLNAYRNSYTLYQDKLRAINYSYRVNIHIVFVTILTTCIGFLGLNFSDTQPFKDFGNITALGIVITLIACVTIVPFLLSILPPIRTSQHRLTNLHSVVTRLVDWIERHTNAIIMFVFLCAFASVFLLQRNELTDDTIGYFSHDLPIRKAAEYTDRNLTGIETIQLSIGNSKDQPNGINNPAFLNKVNSFTAWARTQDVITHVYSYTDILKRLNQRMNQDQPSHYIIPDQASLAAQYLLLYNFSLPQGSDANDLISFDESKLRILLTKHIQQSRRFIEFEETIHEWFNANAPELEIITSGEGLVFAHIGQNNINDMLKGSAVTLIFITFVMILALKSLRYGAISVLPNLLPCLFMFGIWGLVVGQLNMASAMIFSITIGIVVDDTVHLLMKYLNSRRQRQAKAKQALIEMLVHVMPAVITTSLIIAVGFSVLILSDFNANVIMGKMIVIVVLLALFIDLIFVPAVILLIDRYKNPALKNT